MNNKKIIYEVPGLKKKICIGHPPKDYSQKDIKINFIKFKIKF